ncbi:MAG: TolC family protein [Deltaproteobacteria bacterium]|nr:TolC family protein [Deltaproteobacteria bacterium]
MNQIHQLTARLGLLRLWMGIVLMVIGFISPARADSLKQEIDGKPLSLQDCIRIALETNPLQQVTAQGILAAKEALGESRAPYYPELGLQARYAYWQQRAFLPKDLAIPGRPLPRIIGPTEDWMAGLRVRYTLFDSGERRAQYHSALARQGVAEEEKARVTQDLVLGVYQGYYGLAAALETFTVAEKNWARARDHLRLAKERKAAGAVPQADVLRVQVETANAELALVRAEHLVRISRGGLNTLMGLPAERPLSLAVKEVETTAPDFPDHSRALDQALHNRPEIKAALKRIEALKGGVEAAKSAFGPKVRAEGSYGRRDTIFFPQDDEWLAGISIEWPLFTGFFREHRLSRAKSEVSREEAEVRQLLLKVRQEVWTATSRIKETYEAVQTTKVAVIHAQESMRMAKERYEAGAGTVTDLLDSQTALARAQANQVEAEWDYHTAQAFFKRSIGKMQEEGKL